MTLSPQERMEKANPYQYVATGPYNTYIDGKRMAFREGFIAAKKDRDCLQERNDEFVAERDKQKKLITAYMDERAELLNNIDAMIADRDDAYTKRDTLKARVEELEKILKEAFFLASYKAPVKKIESYLYSFTKSPKALTPQPADTPCPECGGSGLKYPAPIIEMREDVPKCQLCNGTGKAQPCEECGTVGGGGKIHDDFDIDGLINDSGEIPCPRCNPPCPECGTVGGGGKVPGMRSFSAACSDQVWKPCPRCGA